MTFGSVRPWYRSTSSIRTKRLYLGRLAGILLPVVHFLLEFLGFFFVHKGQSGQAFLKLKGVEEGSVLVVGKGVINFLVP